ncbi:hypothetical protein BSKO_13340 [Bryopsis sp. KO-2023]|nr:hypothetical protein BSKO_13340 [Bryopsis sp. KO-2023]
MSHVHHVRHVRQVCFAWRFRRDEFERDVVVEMCTKSGRGTGRCSAQTLEGLAGGTPFRRLLSRGRLEIERYVRQHIFAWLPQILRARDGWIRQYQSSANMDTLKITTKATTFGAHVRGGVGARKVNGGCSGLRALDSGRLHRRCVLVRAEKESSSADKKESPAPEMTEKVTEEVVEKAPAEAKGETVYVDELPQVKQADLSKSMKDKMRAEYLGLGGAENTKMGANYFLWIIVGISALAVASWLSGAI